MTARSISAPASRLDIDMRIEAGDWPDETHLEHLLDQTSAMAIAVAGLQLPQDCELSALFTDDEAIRDLNRIWRNKDKPTNVLSFPADDLMPGGPVGDLVFAAETIRREAALDGKTLDAHLQHLMIHGFLHLFGYDHMTDEDALEMETLETAILARLGVADPYELPPDPTGGAD